MELKVAGEILVSLYDVKEPPWDVLEDAILESHRVYPTFFKSAQRNQPSVWPHRKSERCWVEVFEWNWNGNIRILKTNHRMI